MTILHVLFWNLVAPAAMASAAIASARWAGRWGESTGRRGRWGVATGLGLGYLVGSWGLIGGPPFPTTDAIPTVAWLALAATVLGVVEASWTMPQWATWGVRAGFVATAMGLLLRSRIEHGWTTGEAAAWLVGIGAVVLVSWWNLETQGERLTGPGWLVPMALVAAGWSAAQWLSGSAQAAQLEGVLMAALLGALPTVGLRPGPALAKGGSAVVATVLAGLGLTGYFYSDVPAPSAALLALAPWAPWVDRIGFIRRRSYWTRASVRFLAVLLTVGAAVMVADSLGSPPTAAEEGL